MVTTQTSEALISAEKNLDSSGMDLATARVEMVRYMDNLEEGSALKDKFMKEYKALEKLADEVADKQWAVAALALEITSTLALVQRSDDNPAQAEACAEALREDG